MKVLLADKTSSQPSFGIKKKINFSLKDNSTANLVFDRKAVMSNFKIQRKITSTSGAIKKMGRTITKLEPHNNKNGYTLNDVLKIYQELIDKAKYPMFALKKLSSLFPGSNNINFFELVNKHLK